MLSISTMEILPEEYMDCISAICVQIAQFDENRNVFDFLFDTEQDKVVVYKFNTETQMRNCWMIDDENITVRDALSLIGYTGCNINLTYPAGLSVDNYMDTPVKRCELSQFTILPFARA